MAKKKGFDKAPSYKVIHEMTPTKKGSKKKKSGKKKSSY